MKNLLIAITLALALSSESLAKTEPDNPKLAGAGVGLLIGGAVAITAYKELGIDSDIFLGTGLVMFGSGGLLVMSQYYPDMKGESDIGTIGVAFVYILSASAVGGGIYCMVKDCDFVTRELKDKKGKKKNLANHLQLGILPNAGYAGLKFGF